MSSVWPRPGGDGELRRSGAVAPRRSARTARLASVRVTEVRDREGFAALAPQWRELLAGSDVDGLFLTWEWLYTWWTHLGHARPLRILIVHRGGELIGIAPFVLCPAQPGRLIPYRALEFLGSGTAGSDYLDLIVRRGAEHAVTQALCDYLASLKLALDLRRVSLRETNINRLVQELERRRWGKHLAPDDVCLYVPLEGSNWESYFAGLSREFRRSLRRGRRDAVAAYGRVSYIPVKDESERAAALETFVRMHNRRWDERSGSEALPDRDILRFHDAWSRLALARGWLRLALVRFDDTPVAGTYGFCYGRKLYFYLSAFDPAFSRYGAGRICLEENLREAFAGNLLEYDFLHGDEGYKYHWARLSRSLGRYRAFPPGANGNCARAAFRVRERAKASVHGLRARTRRDNGVAR